MKARNTDILISGASIAGPVLAYWLRRHGFHPTVVERAPALRRGKGGHAVDLFGPAVDIAERMGVLPEVQAARTTTQVIALELPGRRPVEVDVSRLAGGISDRHVEIMRGDLAGILYEATRDDVEYVFDDSIRTIDQHEAGVDVSFDRGAPRRFDLVIGADGLHSNVRRLAFGEESRFTRFIGGYLSVYSLPNHLELDGRMLAYNAMGKLVAVYPVGRGDELRALFLFRRATELAYDHRDVEQQKGLLREAFAADPWEVPRLLAGLDGATDFYFDSISQVHMDSWSRGRVTLVGDAGYSPGPAVGGGTTLAAVGAYVLAGELAAARGDHVAAFRNSEHELRDVVARSRAMGPAVMRTLVPDTRRKVWLARQATRFLPRLPLRLQRRLSSLQDGPARVLTAVSLKDYAHSASLT